MNKIIKISMVAGLIFSWSACDDFDNLNVDPKNSDIAPPGALFANATKTLVDFMSSANVNVNNFRLWAQQWAQTTYADESNYDLITRNVNGAAWNTLYSEVIRDLKEAKRLISEDEFLPQATKDVQLATAEVLEVYTFHVLVDIFGDIPYSEAFQEDVTPAYDDDAEIYNDLISRLDAAIVKLSGDNQLGTFDRVYGGDAEQWLKFANSLKLRLALRIAQVDDTKARTMAEQAVQSGVFGSNADNFSYEYLSSPPNTNPLWVDLVQSGRSDFVAAGTLVEPMEAFNDPRLPFYFQDTFTGEFKGGVYGANNTYNAFSHPGALQQDPEFPGVLMTYSEVAFLLADFANRGYNVGGTAAEWYEEGVASSILYWGGTDAEASAYLANPGVAFATASGTPEQKIAFQKWIALYDQGFEAWSTYRIYDYPQFAIAQLSELPTPTRYTYPVTEYSINEANVRAVSDDSLSGRVFWDVE